MLDVVNLVTQDGLAYLGAMENREFQEHLDVQELQEDRQLYAKNKIYHLAIHAHLDHQDHRDQLERAANQEDQEILEGPEPLEPQDLLDQTAHLVIRVLQEMMEKRENLEGLLNQHRLLLASLEILEMLEPPEYQETTGHQEEMVNRDNPALQDRQDLQEMLDKLVHLEKQDNQDCLGHKEKEEYAPSIALSMVGCFSKMVLVDSHILLLLVYFVHIRHSLYSLATSSAAWQQQNTVTRRRAKIVLPFL